MFAATSPNTFVISEGDPGGGGQHSRLSLSESSDAGLTWRHVDDPCAACGFRSTGDVHLRKHWLLSCFLGEGMNQGIGNLWRTNDGGATWTRVQHGDTEATTLVPSGNRHILFGEVAGATGGVVYSTDGGATVEPTPALTDEGGAPESLSTIGPTGAIDHVIGGLDVPHAQRSTWTAVPELSAGAYQGLPICTARDGVSVTFRWKPLRAAVGPSGMIFTNRGSRNCYLDDAPIVQTVSGASRTPVGPPARSTYTRRRLRHLKGARRPGERGAPDLPHQFLQTGLDLSGRDRHGHDHRLRFSLTLFARFRAPTKVCTPFSTVNVNVGPSGLEQTRTHLDP